MTLNSLHNPAYRVQISGQKPSPAPTEPVTPAPSATPAQMPAPAGPDRVRISAEARRRLAGLQPEPATGQQAGPTPGQATADSGRPAPHPGRIRTIA